MRHTEEELHDLRIIHFMVRVQRYLPAHKAFESTLEGTEKEDQAIKFCARDVDCLVRGNKLSSFGNLHTSIQPDEFSKRWAIIKELVKR